MMKMTLGNRRLALKLVMWLIEYSTSQKFL